MELDAIVPIVDENVELFRIFWPPDPHMVQARPGICLIVMVRRAAGGRVLVAMPTALVPAGSLPLEPEESDVIGPHAQFELPAVRMSDGGIEHLGTDVTVQVVDLGADALSALTPLSLVPESEDQGLIGFGEDLDIIPEPTLLEESVKNWLVTHGPLMGVRGSPFTLRTKRRTSPRQWQLRCPQEEIRRRASLHQSSRPASRRRRTRPRRGSLQLRCQTSYPASWN